MRAYVINLARSPERRAHMSAELQKTGMPYKFVDGVDGQELDFTDPKVIDDPAVLDADWFRPGLVGAAFGHLRACEQILADDLDWALVLEDDARLPKDLVSLTETVAVYMDGAEIAVLCALSPGLGKLSRHGLIRLPSSRQLAFPINVNELGGGAAYIITREACKRMVAYIGPYRAHPDDWGYWFNEGALDRVRCVMPSPVRQDPAFVSAILYHDQGGLKARILGMAEKYNINFLNQIIVYRRARIMRNQAKFELADEPFVVNPSRLD
jgi:glycosyl transferase, family 25